MVRPRKGWFGFDGWKYAFPPGLPDIVARLPGGQALGQDKCEWHSRGIAGAYNDGDQQDSTWSRQAGVKQSARELEALSKAAGKLARHIEAMHSPAIDALHAVGTDPAALADMLLSAEQNALDARSELKGPDNMSGRPTHEIAKALTAEAAAVFAEVTGQKPTFTTDPETGKRSGPWPDFAADVFKLFGVKASADAQVAAFAALSEKTQQKTGS